MRPPGTASDTYERNAYPQIVDAYRDAGHDTNREYFIRELYGEQVTHPPVADLEPSRQDLRIINYLSQGDTEKDIEAKIHHCEQTTKKAIQRAISRFAPPVEYPDRRRLTAVKNAIETGAIPIKRVTKAEAQQVRSKISIRQMMAFHLAELGYGNDYIANRMSIKPNGVKTHLLAVTDSLGVHGLTQAVRAIREQGVFQTRRTVRVPTQVLVASGIFFD